MVALHMGWLFKICSREEWSAAKKLGRFEGSAIDRQDGFIHLSAAHQVRETAARHFAGRTGLVLLGIDEASLGDTLKWEPSRGGALFPHIHGALPVPAVAWVKPLPWQDGAHVFPPETWA